MDKVRRIVHPKLKPFHFQIKRYYLCDANYPMDTPPQTLARCVWRSTDLPETIFTRSMRLKQTDRTCWTIQIHSDKLNWARRPTFHELDSLSLIRLMKSSTFGGLGITKKNLILGIFTLQNFISLRLKWNYIILKTKFGALDAKRSLHCSLLLVCNKCSLLIHI